MVSSQEPLSFPQSSDKPKLVIVASPRARSKPGSSLVRLMRDYAEAFKRYEIHATAKTHQLILGTGMYGPSDLVCHRQGEDGGVAELAALVARGECLAAIVLLDPSDPWSDAAENWALKRVCIKRQVRLITTYAAAVRWATYDASRTDKQGLDQFQWSPSNWREGNQNTTELGDFKQLPVTERSMALISHDKMKLEMVEFVNKGDHISFLTQHDRILTTGTTGSVLKLVYANQEQQQQFIEELGRTGNEGHVRDAFLDLLRKLEITPLDTGRLDKLVERMKEKLGVKSHQQFAEKIMPLPSGPDGGDELIAEEVLNNRCHAIVFLQDPMTAHPHAADIRLFERTCQLPGVFAECVSDRQSADRWIEELQQELSGKTQLANLAQELRQTWGLQEVLTVSRETDMDSDDLGHALARICAGYLNLRLQQIAEEEKDDDDEIRVAVAWGWGVRQVFEQLSVMKDEGLIQIPKFSRKIVWSPLIGIITAEITDSEAIMIAHSFCSLYGGRVDSLPCAGFAHRDTVRPGGVNELIEKLSHADIVLTSASPWDKDATLYRNTGLKSESFPGFEDAVGLVSGVFLNEEGTEVSGDYSIVGLDRQGFIEAAQTGTVILMAGGEKRKRVVLAALRARLASVLVTSSLTASWLVTEKATSKAASGT